MSPRRGFLSREISGPCSCCLEASRDPFGTWYSWWGRTLGGSTQEGVAVERYQIQLHPICNPHTYNSQNAVTDISNSPLFRSVQSE